MSLAAWWGVGFFGDEIGGVGPGRWIGRIQDLGATGTRIKNA